MMRKLDCPRAEELIIRDLDEGLDQERLALLESHISQCSSCRRFREETNSLLASVAADVPEDPGEDFWRYYDVSLEARLREKSLNRPWGFGLKLAGVLMVGMLALLVVRWGVMEPQEPRSMDKRVAMLAEFGRMRWTVAVGISEGKGVGFRLGLRRSQAKCVLSSM